MSSLLAVIVLLLHFDCIIDFLLLLSNIGRVSHGFLIAPIELLSIVQLRLLILPVLLLCQRLLVLTVHSSLQCLLDLLIPEFYYVDRSCILRLVHSA